MKDTHTNERFYQKFNSFEFNVLWSAYFLFCERYIKSCSGGLRFVQVRIPTNSAVYFTLQIRIEQTDVENLQIRYHLLFLDASEKRSVNLNMLHKVFNKEIKYKS